MSEVMGMTVEQLDDLCLNWPGATRAMKWDVDLVWSVSGKMFVIMAASVSRLVPIVFSK